ncbi:MAG: TylF/MycF/NovP-related O-methyltransferase [Roseiarcus sp.]
MSDEHEQTKTETRRLISDALTEQEHRFETELAEARRAAEQIPHLLETIQELRSEIFRIKRHGYEDWFNRMFEVEMPTPNTWPFTTFVQDTPWCDEVVAGMHRGEVLYAENLMRGLETDSVEGDIVEFGIYEGAWLEALAEMRERHGWTRTLWGFDSFEGLPEPKAGFDPTCWTKGMYAAPYDAVSMRLRAVDRPWLRLVRGWFSETLPDEPARSIEKIAYARIDSDLYESCADCLKFLEPRLVNGAVLVFDDWQFTNTHGEPRAFKEWMEGGAPFRFQFLAMNSWAHLYVKVRRTDP